MERYRKKWIKLSIVIACIFVFGTLGYYVIEEGWSLLDAFYMVVISVTTVGYGETHDLSPQGRIFTIFLIFIGLGAAGTTLAQLTKFLIEGELQGVFRRKKVNNQIKQIRDHYIVCGHGRSGATICIKLYELDIPFVVIDSEPEKLRAAEQREFLTVPGNAGSDMTLLSSGVERAAGLVICCSDDGTSLLISLAARELNPEINIIALGNFPTNESRMLRAGANTVVYPMRLGSEQIAQLIARQCGASVESGTQSQPHDVFGYDLKMFKHFDAKSTCVSAILGKYKALEAVGLKRSDGEMIDRPAPDTAINQHDSIVMLVRQGQNGEPDSGPVFEKIVWSEKYSVGINAIDDEHRGLVILINKFNEALETAGAKLETARTFDRLLDYTVTHFNNEEDLMKKYGYPGLEDQIGEHRNLTREVMELNKDRQYVFPGNIVEFLNAWLINHIMETDKKLGDFLLQQGVR